MNEKKKIQDINFAAVIPCLNEEKTIGITIKNIKKLSNMIYVCDNASNDKTIEEQKDLGFCF